MSIFYLLEMYKGFIEVLSSTLQVVISIFLLKNNKFYSFNTYLDKSTVEEYRNKGHKQPALGTSTDPCLSDLP